MPGGSVGVKRSFSSWCAACRPGYHTPRFLDTRRNGTMRSASVLGAGQSGASLDRVVSRQPAWIFTSSACAHLTASSADMP
jgi:hypothetical protein